MIVDSSSSLANQQYSSESLSLMEILKKKKREKSRDQNDEDLDITEERYRIQKES